MNILSLNYQGIGTNLTYFGGFRRSNLCFFLKEMKYIVIVIQRLLSSTSLTNVVGVNATWSVSSGDLVDFLLVSFYV